MDEEGDEAERLAVFDSSGVASIDGGERRPTVLGHGHGAARIRVRARGKRTRERERVGLGVLFILQGAQRHGDSGGVVATARARAARSLQRIQEEEGIFAKTPWLLFSGFKLLKAAA